MRCLLPALLFATAWTDTLAAEANTILVYGHGEAAPLAQVAQKRIGDIPNDDPPDDGASKNVAKWDTPGQRYHYIGRDNARGIGTVTKPVNEDLGCSSNAAGVEIEVNTDSVGLLSTDPLPEDQGHRIQGASPAQRVVLQHMARPLLMRRGVPPAIVSWMTAHPVEGSFAIPAHGATPTRIIGSFEWDSTTAAMRTKRRRPLDAPFNQYTLTLILQADARSQYHISKIWFNHARSEDSRSSYDFHTAADLDGDGNDEIIMIKGGYEWYQYEVFGQRHKKWLSLATGGGGGC